MGAAPITGGASAFAVGLGWAGAVSGSVQCLNSGVRIYGELFDEDLLNVLDSDIWYTNVMRALDAVSLIGAGVGTYGTLRMVLALRASTGKGMLEVLKGLSRQQRNVLRRKSSVSRTPASATARSRGWYGRESSRSDLRRSA